MKSNSMTGKNLLDKIRKDFIGLETEYTLATGDKTRRIYLDSTATTLMMKAARDVMESLYHHYANTHSQLHFSAKIATNEYHWAHDRILSFVGGDPDRYTCFFTGSGTTAGMNRVARILRKVQPDKDTSIISIMEHHSNDLPHRKQMKNIIHIPVDRKNGQFGCICMETLEKVLKKNNGQVNYVAMTGVSNVTGIENPIYDAAEITHKYGALMLVDGAQLVAHQLVKMVNPKNENRNIDILIFSGHKTYVPGSPGVVIARKDLLSQIEPEEVGGGMVEMVFTDNYLVKSNFPDREEAGTPNIPGAIGLAAAIDILDKIGMEFIQEEEDNLVNTTLQKMMEIPDIIIYGEPDTTICKRTASISFNMNGLDHGMTAAVLNDYFNIAVRNECFCAHPYVKEMVFDEPVKINNAKEMKEFRELFHLKKGMVRASFGIYSTHEDVDALISALIDISKRKEFYSNLYHVNSNGDYNHNHFTFDHIKEFSAESLINNLIQQEI